MEYKDQRNVAFSCLFTLFLRFFVTRAHCMVWWAINENRNCKLRGVKNSNKNADTLVWWWQRTQRRVALLKQLVSKCLLPHQHLIEIIFRYGVNCHQIAISFNGRTRRKTWYITLIMFSLSLWKIYCLHAGFAASIEAKIFGILTGILDSI